MRDPWFQAFFIMPPTMCGVRLLPYSLAHDYILTHLGNQYVILDRVPNEADFFEAVTVCGRTWEENRAFYMGAKSPWWKRTLARWSKRWHKKMKFDIASENLKTYLTDYMYVAEHHKSATPGNPNVHPIASPFHWHVVRCLCNEYHMTVSEAWNTAFNKAKCLFDVWSESQGADTLESLHDMKVNDLMREAKVFYEAGDLEKMQAKYREVEELCNYRQAALKERE